jgi:rhodanese-related sulfurtransferase
VLCGYIFFLEDKMGLMDYIKPVPTKTADEVREFLDTHDPEEYNLIDVRQPGEYADGHLPGAQLIPSRELLSRVDELDPDKPTITY